MAEKLFYTNVGGSLEKNVRNIEVSYLLLLSLLHVYSLCCLLSLLLFLSLLFTLFVVVSVFVVYSLCCCFCLCCLLSLLLFLSLMFTLFVVVSLFVVFSLCCLLSLLLFLSLLFTLFVVISVRPWMKWPFTLWMQIRFIGMYIKNPYHLIEIVLLLWYYNMDAVKQLSRGIMDLFLEADFPSIHQWYDR